MTILIDEFLIRRKLIGVVFYTRNITQFGSSFW